MVALYMLNAALATLGPSERTIREGFCEDDVHWPYNKQVYLAYGPLAYPAYRAILDDKKSTSTEVTLVLSILYATKIDIRYFTPQLVRLLTSDSAHFRAMATELLGRHATATDAPQFAVLLFDPDKYVLFRAAEALSKVGDRNALTALELWQTSKANTAHPGYRAVVKDYENALRKRLEKEEAEKKKVEPPKK
jgi:hypothetical protein